MSHFQSSDFLYNFMHVIWVKLYSINLKFLGQGCHRFSQIEISPRKHCPQAFAANLPSRIHFTKGKCYQDKIHWFIKAFWSFRGSQEFIILWFSSLYLGDFQLSYTFWDESLFCMQWDSFTSQKCWENYKNIFGPKLSRCMAIFVYNTLIILYSFEPQSLMNLCRFEKIKHGFY